MFRVGESEPGEVFLGQRRVFIVPSRAGLMLGVTLILLFIGAVNYNLSMGFGLTFLLGACAVVDMHLTFRNLAHLHLSPGRSKPVFAGENAQFELNLVNRRKHDRYAIWIGFVDRDAGVPEKPVDLPAHSATTVSLAVPALQRGLQQIPRLKLRTRFPLGLLQAWSYWQPDAAVLVYPRPEDGHPPLPVGQAPGSEGSGRLGHDDFAGIRAYQPGDPLRHLAWRQIARLDPASGAALVTKQFEGGAAERLIIDFHRFPATLDTEARLSRMARWILDAEARNLPYGFRLGAFMREPACGPAHRHACLEALALHDAS